MLLSFCSCSHNESSKDQDFYSDLPTDTLFPASSRELSIKVDTFTIYGLLYLAQGKGPHPTVIFLNGFPGFERNLDIAQVLRRKGWNSVSFNYSGSWGSEGHFSYKNCIQNIDAILKDLKRDKAYDLEGRIDSNNFVLIGNSFGGGVAMNYLKSKKGPISKVILLSSFNIGGFANHVEKTQQIEAYKNFLSQKKQIKFDGVASYVADVLDNRMEYNYELHCKEYLEKSILIIDENDKHKDFVECLQSENVQVEYHVLGKNHSFSSDRIKLTKLIFNWLNKK